MPLVEPALGQAIPGHSGRSNRPREDRYEVKSQIASGGMGVVYRVVDRATGAEVALKRIAKQSEAPRVALERFEREYQVLASLDHPRIIRVFDYGLDDEGPYYTMELLDGRDMQRVAPVPFRTACLHLRDIATSLALLHGRRLLHRDLSPSNVRVTPDGHCKLLDFGALTPFGAAAELVGTPPIVAPEALASAPLDQRTDLYALGALAYFVLTGRHAYPAKDVLELTDYWSQPLAPPSSLVPDVPHELDALVLSLLSRDLLARPVSAAEVITRLDVIGELPAEDRSQTERLASSYLTSPRFTGRSAELRELSTKLDRTLRGRGAAVLVEAAPGMGTTRLLEEHAVRARMAGATVVSIDASSARERHGTSRALVSRLFQLFPVLAHERAPAFEVALCEIGMAAESAAPASPDELEAREPTTPGALAELIAEISRDYPLVIEVDNFEQADVTSQGLLATLASLAENVPLMLILGTVPASSTASGIGTVALRRHSQTIALAGLSSPELLGMLRSMFGDAPNLERFAEWLHALTAGGPLHAVEVCRSLFASGVIHYASGFWTLPTARPSAELPIALGDALARRLDALGAPARALAECLSLQRDKPSLALCTLLCRDAPEPETRARSLLEELTHAEVLSIERNVYRFSSSALRDAALQRMTAERLEDNHRRLGEAFAQLAAADDQALHIEAGFHLIEGADERRGAEMIARVANDSSKFRMLLANHCRAGRPIEAAFKVYRRARRSAYEHAPLLAALAVLGYFEEREYGEKYGDQALDVLSRLTGLDTARSLRRYLGRPLALAIGVSFAYARFLLTPRTARPCSFGEILQQFLGAVHALAGTASVSLDAQRATKVVSLLEPFTLLPDRFTPVGIYQFCSGLADIARENEADTYATFERLLRCFSNPRYYPKLPSDARATLTAGVHFARASLAIFRADGSAALASADALDATGLKLYAMVASQLRFLYYAARGEFSKAALHRDQVELHAAYVGSVWQVETWEGAALTLIHATAIGEVVSLARVAHQLEALSRSVPSLRRYSRLASIALIALHRDERYYVEARKSVSDEIPRSYIGWAAVQSVHARSFNQTGDYEVARSICAAALQHVTEADREFVALFLSLDLEMAVAEAGLGQVDVALARIDGLLTRFASSDHPLLKGLLHECRARIAWQAGRVDDYRRSVAEVERWFRPTGTPALIAKFELLAALSGESS